MVYYVAAIGKEIKTILKVNFLLQFKLIPSWQLCGFTQSWQIHCNHVHWWKGVKLVRLNVPNPGHYIMNLEYQILQTFWKQNFNIFSPMHQVLWNHGVLMALGLCLWHQFNIILESFKMYWQVHLTLQFTSSRSASQADFASHRQALWPHWCTLNASKCM